MRFRALRTIANFEPKGTRFARPLIAGLLPYCIENDLLLLHIDRDFDPFKKHLGLKVLSSLA